MSEYGFELTGVAWTGAQDVLGGWQVAAASGVSFDAGPAGVAAPSEPTWRVRLPASADQAQAVLDAQRDAARRSDSALAQAERRLAQLSRGGEGVSFAPGGPEAELLAALSPGVSFGLTDQLDLGGQWRTFVEQVRSLMSHYARVETEIGGAFVGRTSVGWTGDFEIVWRPGVGARDMGLHEQSVRLALASRQSLIRMVTVIAGGAAGLALKLSVPGGQVMALPAVFKFVRDVLREWNESQSEISNLKSQI
jgi:hypothetical protein